MAEVDRWAEVKARADLVLDDRIQAHRRTAEEFDSRTSLTACRIALTEDYSRLTYDQMADCLAVAVDRLAALEERAERAFD